MILRINIRWNGNFISLSKIILLSLRFLFHNRLNVICWRQISTTALPFSAFVSTATSIIKGSVSLHYWDNERTVRPWNGTTILYRRHCSPTNKAAIRTGETEEKGRKRERRSLLYRVNVIVNRASDFQWKRLLTETGSALIKSWIVERI